MKKKTKKKNKHSWIFWIRLIVLTIVLLTTFGAGIYYKVNQANAKQEKPTPVITVQKEIDPNALKVMSWNIYNYGSKTKAGDIKLEMIKDVILKTDADLIGLSEISYADKEAVETLKAQLLNKYEYTFFDYDNIYTKADTFNESFPNSKESVAIFYKPNRLRPLNNNGYYLNIDNIYTRPLYYNAFETLDKKYKFVSVFGHFDAPSANKNNNEKLSSEFSGNGEQEIKEAKAVENVFTTLKAFYPNTDIIFGADTNIKTNNNNVFSQKNYKLAYNDYENNQNLYLTSLSSRPKNNEAPKYANAYDKWMIYDADSKNIYWDNQFKIDILRLFDDKFFDYDKLSAIYKQQKQKSEVIAYDIIKNMSDHAPILIDIKLPQ